MTIPASEASPASPFASLYKRVAGLRASPGKHHARQTSGMRLALLRTAYDSGPVGLCVLDHQFRYLEINEYLALLHGRSRTDMIGRTLREASPLCADYLEPLVRDVLRTGRAAANVEWMVPGNDAEGERVWTIGIQPIRAEDGSIAGASIALTEIAPRSRAGSRCSSEAEHRPALARGVEVDARHDELTL